MSMSINRANILLARVRRSIARIDARLDKSHGLGDSESAQGISSSHLDNPDWENRLSELHAAEDWLVAYIDWMNAGCTGPKPGPLGRNLSAWGGDR